MLTPGTVLDGRYAIRNRLGAGGMGEVYRAERLVLGDEVAIKVVRASDEDPAVLRERFLRESRAAARLRHPHIITILDFAIDPEGRPYLVMEYLNGPSLGEALATRGRFDLASFRHVMASLCSALQLAHDCGLVHRDLKPANVISQRYETGEVVWKIIDFGLVNVVRPEATPMTELHQFMGTAAYASPEQVAGAATDGRTDLYALGVVAYELLAGVRPFQGDSLLAIVEQQMRAAPADLGSLRPDLPADVTAAVMRCLAKDPADRWPSASALARALASDEAPTTTSAALPVGGGLLATYEVGPIIGRGRFGSDIHEGMHRALGHPVAIRMFRPSAGVDHDAVKARFLAEARALQISHPNIVNVRDFGEAGGTLYVVTDLLEGCSLAELLKRDGPCTPERLHAFVGQLADAAGAIHRRGGFVCGLHPEIIRVAEEPGRERVAISSAGIGTVHDLLATLSEAALRGRATTGTELPYVAPEVLMGKPISVASDVFTIGVLAYQLSTATLPFAAASLPELLGVMMSRRPAPLASLRPDIRAPKAAVIERALAMDPSSRFESASAFLEAWMERA